MKSDKKMRLGLFIPTFKRDYNKIESTFWIRVLQMINHYKSLGVKVHINNFFLKYDASIFYRGQNKKIYYYMIKYLKLISKKVYWDQIANFFEKNDDIPNDQIEISKKISKIVDGVIVPTDFLKSRAKRLNSNIFIMPDPIDTKKFSLLKDKINYDDPKFVWSGVFSKSIFLNKYSREIDGRIILITDKNIKKVHLNFDYTFIPWNYKTFHKDILLGDVCFAPRRPDNLYDKGHSSFKILVFANANMPVICNKIPSYVKLSEIYSGIEFLEDNKQSVILALSKLKKKTFNNQKLREEYSCKNVAERLISYLKKEIGEK